MTLAVRGKNVVVHHSSTGFFINRIHKVTVPRTGTTTLDVCRVSMIVILLPWMLLRNGYVKRYRNEGRGN